MTDLELFEAVETAAGWLARPLDDADWREIFREIAEEYDVTVERVQTVCRARWNMLGA